MNMLKALREDLDSLKVQVGGLETDRPSLDVDSYDKDLYFT